LVLPDGKPGFTQQQAWFCPTASLVLLNNKLGFAQRQTWFYSTISLVLPNGKLPVTNLKEGFEQAVRYMNICRCSEAFLFLAATFSPASCTIR
jgi:hypothetical protein